MKLLSLIAGLVCSVSPIGVSAQNLTTYLTGAPPSSASGTASYDPANYESAHYGSGKYPHLQAALAALNVAEQSLGNANPAAKGIYLPRAIQGVRFAITDIKLAIDHNDGTTITTRALPELPTGVGNMSSNLEVVLTKTPRNASPFMDMARASLIAAMNELNYSDPGNSGVFIQRAKADIAFTLDNANAGVNLANGYPPYQAKVVVTAKPMNYKMIGGSLVGLIILVLVTIKVFLHERRKGSN